MHTGSPATEDAQESGGTPAHRAPHLVRAALDRVVAPHSGSTPITDAAVPARDEDVRLGPVQAHDARIAVGIVLRISRCPLLGDLVY